MLEPIYRIEFFLDAIVNNTIPPEPIYRAEFYLAKIAGADVEIPEPVYRMEKYLAYLCGEEVELPDPIYRIEYYLAFLCGLNVELPEPIYRVEFWLWDWCGGGGIEKTVTGNPIHITDALAKPVQALSIALEPIQAGSGDPSPDNVRPISGHTDADVIVSSTLNPSDGTTYPIPLGQTVYGGTLDVLTGVLTVTHAFGTYNGSEQWGSGTNYFVLWNQPPSKSNSDTTQIANWLVGGGDSYADQGKFRVQTNGALCVGNRGGVYADVTAFKAALAETPLQVCYELATPITIQLTPTQVELLLGENNIFSDGEMTLVYLADGNASEIEALNILLGGRYVNNHGEDEPTDREALNIILGGNER